MLMMKTSTVQQVKELAIQFQPDTLMPNTEADIVFSIITDLTAVCRDYGLLSESGLPNYFITGEIAKVIQQWRRGLHCHIQVFTAEGEFLRRFGRHGRGRGKLDNPISIAVNDGLYVHWRGREWSCLSVHCGG